MRTQASSLKPQAFTLVELMVVITIIAILLALLTPAMDQAIYQAELTVCGAQLGSIGGNVLAAAVERQRRYPAREVYEESYRIMGSAGGHDDRPAVRPYVGTLKMLACPLAGGNPDYEAGVADPNGAAGHNVITGYSMWFGWQYEGAKGLRKVGDRWSTIDGYEFNLLAGDYEHYNYWGTISVAGSHPDKDGVMQQQVFDREGSWLSPVGDYILARWINEKTSDRGLVDMNQLYQDGAVHRLTNVKREESDERMVRVPPRPDNYGQTGTAVYLIVPRN